MLDPSAYGVVARVGGLGDRVGMCLVLGEEG